MIEMQLAVLFAFDVAGRLVATRDQPPLLGPIGREWRGPAYVLPAELPQDGRARVVAPAEAPAWREAFR